MTVRARPPRRPSTRPAWHRCSIRPARGACCPPPRTSTTRCSPGSAAPVRRRVGVRRPVDRAGGRRVAAGRAGRRRRRAPRARRRRRAARLLQRVPAPGPRAGAVRRHERAPLDPLPVPRLALRPRRHAAVDAAVRRRPRVRPGRARARAGRRRGVARLGHGERRRGRRRRSAEFFAGIERARRRPRAGAAGRRRNTSLRAGGELEARSSRTTTSASTARTSIPSCARVSPPTSGENYDGHDGMWVGGWHGPEPHAVTMSLDRRVRGGADARRSRRGPAAQSSTSALLPNLLVSLHPDYVMTHRLEPLAPDRTAVECQWLFAPRGRGRRRLRPVVRGRLLGPHQPPGLGGVRGRAARRASRGYRPGPVLRPRRTPSPSSSAWSPPPTSPGGWTRR